MNRAALIALVLAPTTALAEPLQIVTDLPPVGALVRAVAGPDVDVSVLIGPGDDAHHFQLRPSQARAMGSADVVVWIGEAMTPWLVAPLETLGKDATLIELMDLPGTHLRETGHEGADDHDTHDDHDDHAEGGHDHGAIDPHAWLDPVNTSLWAGQIAAVLGAANPEQADQYAANAATLSAAIDAAAAEVAGLMTQIPDRSVLPYHDAFGYFFDRYDLAHLPPLVDETGSAPGAARLQDVIEQAQAGTLRCILATPEADPAEVAEMVGNTDVAVVQFNQLGADPDGSLAALYLDLAQTLAGCVNG